MSTKQLAFGGVICALASTCIAISSLLHLFFPLAISCVFFYLCARRSGNTCALIVVFASNIIGFLLGGFGSGEIIFSVLLFSPLAVIIYMTRPLSGNFALVAIRAVIFMVFAAVIYILFATVLREFIGFDFDLGVGVVAFGAIWTVIITFFGFAIDRGCELIAKRFFK